MLTRLLIYGFKNLVDIDVRFGPFTCVAGENGVGKSNLFDAIRFLGALADGTFLEAASVVRDEVERTGDFRDLFFRAAPTGRMSFQAELIVPAAGIDDLGQTASATATFLSYSLEFGVREGSSLSRGPVLELLREELHEIKKNKIESSIAFPTSPKWRRSALKSSNRTSAFISTEGPEDNRVVRVHPDESPTRSRGNVARDMPRTALSRIDGRENPTALLARREMQSWRRLQLEPVALRQSDHFNSPSQLGQNGSHLPATLDRLARTPIPGLGGTAYEQIARRLHELIRDVQSVRVDRDNRRETLTVSLVDRAGAVIPARSLSDGTLRFLALSVLELDPESQGLICLEEPENGVHPDRLPALVRLLRDIATDSDFPVAPDNPLRQVIVNTHSPGVIAAVEDGELLWASSIRGPASEHGASRLALEYPANSWRADVRANGKLANPPLIDRRRTGSNVKVPRTDRFAVDSLRPMESNE